MDESPRVFIDIISVVSRLLKGETERRLSGHGLHVGQQFILELLWEQDGLSPGQIAARLNIEPPTATQSLRRMAAAGLVGFGSDAADGRRVKVWLTRRGRSLRNVVPRIMSQLDQDALAKLSDDERAELVRLLDLVRSALSRERDRAKSPKL